MCHRLLTDAKLPEVLRQIDDELAAETRAGGCPSCRGVLHSARYRRKSRGEPPGCADYERRRSFCCARCRRRATPPSVRFLGRRVYVGCVVVLLSAMLHGITPSRAARLKEFLGVSRRTLSRWRAWWLTRFPATKFWKSAKARFARVVEVASLPASLLDAFAGSERERLVMALRLLSPLSASAGLAS